MLKLKLIIIGIANTINNVLQVQEDKLANIILSQSNMQYCIQSVQQIYIVYMQHMTHRNRFVVSHKVHDSRQQTD